MRRIRTTNPNWISARITVHMMVKKSPVPTQVRLILKSHPSNTMTAWTKFIVFIIFTDWSSDDDYELVGKVKALTKENDKVNFKTRLTQFDWSGVTFKNYTANACEKRFKCHLKNVRRFRTFSEIVHDVEANVKRCPVKKPLNSYQLFIQEQLASATTAGDFVCTNLYHF